MSTIRLGASQLLGPILLGAVTLSYSCVKEVLLNSNQNGLYVLNCILTNDSIQSLSLTRSVSVSGNFIYHGVPDAEVSLWKGSELVGSFRKVGYDKWELNYTPVSGNGYSIEALLPDGVKLSASTIMPQMLAIAPQHDLDSHLSRHFKQQTFGSPCWVMILSTDSILHPNAKPDKSSQLKVHLGTDHPLADRFNQDGNLLSILPNADTPAFLFYIRLGSMEADALYEPISFRLQTNFSNHTLICFRSASAEYDKYLKTSFQKILLRRDESDPIIWFDETRVFSNVENGVGIFAAYADQYFIYNSDDNSR